MTIHRALFGPLVLLLLVVMAGWAANRWGGLPAHAADTWRATMVPISGTVKGTPESVLFWGQARVNSRLAPDPDFNRPSLVLSIDLTGVSGVGSSTGTNYVISGPEIVQRRLAASHLVEFTFPFFASGTRGIPAAGSGGASFELSFDVSTGAVTAATASIASPKVR